MHGVFSYDFCPFYVKQRPQPRLYSGGKAETKSLPQDGEFSGGRAHRCGSSPSGSRFVHIQSWPEAATHCSWLSKGTVCAWHPDAPCEQQRGADGWLCHNEKWINVSSHPVLAFSLRKEAQQRSYDGFQLCLLGGPSPIDNRIAASPLLESLPIIACGWGWCGHTVCASSPEGLS